MKVEKKQKYIIGNDEAACNALECLFMVFGVETGSFISVEKIISAA